MKSPGKGHGSFIKNWLSVRVLIRVTGQLKRDCSWSYFIGECYKCNETDIFFDSQYQFVRGENEKRRVDKISRGTARYVGAAAAVKYY